MGGDFLICTDSVPNTGNLFKILNQLKEGQEVTASITNDSAKKIVLAGYVGITLCYIPLVFYILLKTYIWIFGRLNEAITTTLAF